MRPQGLRGRLLTAFVLVAVPPLIVLAAAVNLLLARSYERATGQRLGEGLRTAERQIETRRRRVQEQVEAAVREDLATAPADPEMDAELVETLGRDRDLDVLEILDGEGRVIASRHWAAGLGLPDRDGLFPGQDAFRLETVGQGHGAVYRLALTAARRTTWRGRPALVRGGVLLDPAFLGELSDLMGLEVAFRDGVRKRWMARDSSPLEAWPDPDLDRTGEREVALPGGSYRWAAERRAPELWLLVATPRTALEALTSGVRRVGLGVAVVAVLSALLAALLLSGRIARPVRELADGAARVAGGDLSARVYVSSPDEIGELARTFNVMTEELRASRERVVQAERVAAWREMARRLAHELKNPLFPIQLSIETLRRVLDQQDERSGPESPASDGRFHALFLESSETILQELTSLRKIIDEFSQFARMPRPELRPLDLNAVVEQALSLYGARANGVAIERSLAPDLPAVPADRDLLARALGNLLANALEAMPHGGALRVRTVRVPEGVAVEVEDTGPGLSDDQRTRLFTPYYTTKKGGTGLGLAIVQGIVSDHGGRVQVKSEPGQGTAFRLVLPLHDGSGKL